jgi:glutathione reductase (NADPH)
LQAIGIDINTGLGAPKAEAPAALATATTTTSSSGGRGMESTAASGAGKGAIPVDKYQNTGAAQVYALGDVCGRVELTPMAIAAGRRLADR